MDAAPRHHAAAAAAASAAMSGVRMAGLQLLQAQSTLAPWIERQAPLPFPLIHGPIELLELAVQLTESPHASAKLIDDTVILLTYGASYLQDHDDESQRSLERIQAFSHQMESYKTQWKRKAQRVQATWRTQRFHTNRLPQLELETSKYLQQDVQELIQRKNKNETGQRQDSLTDLLCVPVEINEQELHNQVVTYAAELQRRVAARQRDADEQQRQQVQEQRAHDDKRKRLMVQKKKRYERACRTWHYFATKMLRNARQQQERDDSARRLHLLTAAPSAVAEKDNDVARAVASANGADQTQSMLKALKNPAQRQAVRRFVAKAIARGVSRVLCAYNMGTMSPRDHADDGNAAASSLSARTDGNAETATSTTKVLRLGLLLCDLHFGAKYTGLYQRFFERVANERGMRVEWHVFNCLKSQFPTKAHQRVVNGFLVAGGPNIGIGNDESTAVADGGAWEDERADRAQRRRSSGGAGSNGVRKNRHFGRWRQRLVVLLRDLYRRKQTILGGLGLGHVILAEALGGKIGMKEWEDGWSLLDPTIFTEETGMNTSGMGQGQSHERRLGQSMQGVRFLHGEFVQSMASAGPAKPRLKMWQSPGDHSFVACFRDKLTLSMDGSPECGAFVFETLGEFYERDKMVRLRHSEMATKSSTRRLETRDDRVAADEEDDDEDEDEEDDFRPLVLDTSLSLEEKRKRLGIADASVAVARLFFDHFHRQIVNVSRHVNPQDARMSITGVVCSGDEMHVARSIRQLARDESISAIFLNVSASSDGHLVVTNPQAFALLTDHERRQRENQGTKQQQQQRVSSGVSMVTITRRNSLSRPQEMTLQMLRDHGRLQPSSRRSSTRLPSIRPAASSTKSLSEILPSGGESGYQPHGQFRRTSTLASQRLGSTGEGDNVSVLTLSQALSSIAKGDSKPRVLIRWSDEECPQTHDLVALNKSDLRTLWLRLIAAIRIADLPNDQIAIVSRHSLLLDFIKRKRPTWTFVKDCRRSLMTHRKRLRKVAQYAGVADVLLLDQEFLLSNSANENDALLKKAHALGLHVYVAPRDESPAVLKQQPPPDKLSPPRSSFRRVSKSSSARRSVGGLSKEISSKTNPSGSGSGNAEYDMHVVEFMLLAFSGLDGVVTSHPAAAADALQKIAAKSDAMQQVEQLFREWQAKDTSHKTGISSAKRMSSSGLDDGAAGDSDDPADYVAGDNQYDSDDSVPENEIVTEMARQWTEHNQSMSGISAGRHSGGEEEGGGGGGGGSGAGAGAAVRGADVVAVGYEGSLASPPFVPLRPLQPRPSNQVFGVAGIRRESSARGSAFGDGRSQVRSIGSFRAAFKRMASEIPPQQAFGLTPAQTTSDGKHGDSAELRTPEGIALKPMSTRRTLFMPR